MIIQSLSSSSSILVKDFDEVIFTGLQLNNIYRFNYIGVRSDNLTNKTASDKNRQISTAYISRIQFFFLLSYIPF